MPNIRSSQSARGNLEPGQASGTAGHTPSTQEMFEGDLAECVSVCLSAACWGYPVKEEEHSFGVFSFLSNLLEEETTTRDSRGGGFLGLFPASWELL